jgi:hypothetical protein
MLRPRGAVYHTPGQAGVNRIPKYPIFAGLGLV